MTQGYRGLNARFIALLELIGLSKRYGAIRALDDVSFQAPRGRMLGFLGPNGAGKTMTRRAIFGLVRDL